MHEMSLALEICRLAEEAVYPADPRRVRAVGVELGDRANVEPASLEFCLEALLLQPPFGHGRPAITRAAGDVLRLDYVEVEDASTTD
jgi:Zn finger protein HypA/HybF involved in hydrogenase expression